MRLWAPILGECSEEMSGFLFRKYVGYLEKFTTLKRVNVWVGGDTVMGRVVQACGFQKASSGMYSVNRSQPVTK